MLIVPAPAAATPCPTCEFGLEPARDLVARAQAACDEDQRGAMLRAFAELHSLYVPLPDRIDALRS
jgi:hypothetical protein